ncbi:hypothetical protein EmuJ_000161200 [Echinococcus multilocularis]|uniref:Uncharacterized protein n=1 Tax=Echinococcus multilocularis TaxID=6211 RepID=A0A087W005_ECHMU|nr:hypothetical protein EmuJ_000161200 [Echinococcus multilocularis]
MNPSNFVQTACLPRLPAIVTTIPKLLPTPLVVAAPTNIVVTTTVLALALFASDETRSVKAMQTNAATIPLSSSQSAALLSIPCPFSHLFT